MDKLFLFQIIIFLSVSVSITFIISAVKSYVLWWSTKKVSVKVIGYKYSKPWGTKLRFLNVMNSISFFMPLVEYKEGDKTVTPVVKNMRLSAKIGETIELRLHNQRHVSTLFLAHFALGFGSLGFIPSRYFIYSRKDGHYDFDDQLLQFFLKIAPTLIPVSILSLLLILAYGILSEKESRKLKSWQFAKLKIRLKAPKGYDNYSVSDYKDMESQDMVSYEEMLAYNFRKNHSPISGFITIIILILIMSYVFAL